MSEIIDVEVVSDKNDRSVIAKNDKKANSLKNLKPIPKGTVLNPTGRPKMPDELKLMIKNACPDAIRSLIDLAQKSRQESTRLRACEILLDRAYGKPLTQTDITSDGERINNIELVEIIKTQIINNAD